MIVTKVEPVAKDRNRVTFDNGEKVVLYKGEMRLLMLKDGSEISDDTYGQIVKVVLPRRCKLRAMNLLKERDYTEYQLRKKLLDAEYPSYVVDEAVSYVKSFGYVNDERYARAYIEEQAGSRSKREIYQKLVQKGISADLLEHLFDDIYPNDRNDFTKSDFDESLVIKKTLLKRHFTGNETYEEKQKILAYFYRRGFEIDAVYKAMDSLKND